MTQKSLFKIDKKPKVLNLNIDIDSDEKSLCNTTESAIFDKKPRKNFETFQEKPKKKVKKLYTPRETADNRWLPDLDVLLNKTLYKNGLLSAENQRTRRDIAKLQKTLKSSQSRVSAKKNDKNVYITEPPQHAENCQKQKKLRNYAIGYIGSPKRGFEDLENVDENGLPKIGCGNLNYNDYSVTDVDVDNLLDNEIFNNRVFSRSNQTGRLLPLPDDVDLLISWDTEYQQIDEKNNDIISTQVCAVYDCKQNGRRIISFILWHTPEKKRFLLAEILSLTIKKLCITEKYAKDLNISMYAHFSIAEWSTLKDRVEVIQHVDKVRKYIHTFSPFKVSCSGFNKRKFDVNVHMRDSMLLAPAGFASLKKISSFTSVKKIDLTYDEITNMKTMLENDREKFINYAMNDVYTLLEFIMFLNDLFKNHFKLERMPVTLGDFSIKLHDKFLSDLNNPLYDINRIKGYVKKTSINKNGSRKKRYYPCKLREYTDDNVKKTYYGGLNTSYVIGDFNNEDYVILDFDFSGAYPSAMAVLPLIDWSKSCRDIRVRNYENITKISKINYRGVEYSMVNCGVVSGEFNFNDNELFPSAPTYTKEGLMYFKNAKTNLTLPEYELTKRKNAACKSVVAKVFNNVSNVSFNNKNNEKPLLAFAEFLAYLTLERAKYPKGSLLNLLYKEAANSFYGKMAQGVAERPVSGFGDKIFKHHNVEFSSASESETKNASRELEPSKITTPIYASMTTGIVRAALIEMLDGVTELGCIPLSATTDGAMIAVPKTLINQEYFDNEETYSDVTKVCPLIFQHLSTKKWCSVLNGGRVNMGLPNDTWLEIKHRGDFAKTIKTRFYYMTYNGVIQHVARGGHKVPDGVDVQEFIDNIVESKDIEKIVMKKLASPNDILYGVVNDVVFIDINKNSNADYDFKNKPNNYIKGMGTFCVPWNEYEEFGKYRESARIIRSNGNRADFERVSLNIAGVQLRGGSKAGITRQVLRLIVNYVDGWQPKNEHGKYLKMVEIVNHVDLSIQALQRLRGKTSKRINKSTEAMNIVIDITSKLNIEINDVMLSKLFL